MINNTQNHSSSIVAPSSLGTSLAMSLGASTETLLPPLPLSPFSFVDNVPDDYVQHHHHHYPLHTFALRQGGTSATGTRNSSIVSGNSSTLPPPPDSEGRGGGSVYDRVMSTLSARRRLMERRTSSNADDLSQLYDTSTTGTQAPLHQTTRSSSIASANSMLVDDVVRRFLQTADETFHRGFLVMQQYTDELEREKEATEEQQALTDGASGAKRSTNSSRAQIRTLSAMSDERGAPELP
ncbi:Hypothetical protein, putative [Bodo saltans]|uniref:Uncharacterized protein n=1 Tax=Bodo saltans TaxID=75058 RepID=A0A0S4IRJ1_BODSA|nr:Hypothetical protein, putative [Bodo saltans]|eukprot:CUF38796.1 Hypothetical protein, putative [Bodo saltans]